MCYNISVSVFALHKYAITNQKGEVIFMAKKKAAKKKAPKKAAKKKKKQ